MKAINERIASAEKAHELKCQEIDNEAEQKKADHADFMVNEIIGKLL